MERPATILLVEDNVVMLEGISDLLELGNLGYDLTVITATNGRDGLEEMAKQTPDLVVSDINMPYMDGEEFLEHIRQNPDWEQIPVIFLTAKGGAQSIHRAKVLGGVDQYITKPFDSEDFKQRIKGQLDRTFQRLHNQQQQSTELNQRILRMLNHEMNTPLTYVSAYTDMLVEGVMAVEDDDTISEYIRGIQAGCDRLLRLVNNFMRVLDLREKTAQKNYEQNGQVIADINNLISQAIKQAVEKNAPKTVSVQFNPADKPFLIWGYRDDLLIALEQLIDNAIKFTYAQRNIEGEVSIALRVHNEALNIIIRDEGTGFPSYIRSKIFDLFFQHNRESYEQQGTGIGLTIAKELIDAHKGLIRVESEMGKGSTFTIVLPIYHEDSSVQARESVGKQATVLVVEDDFYLLTGLKELLEIASEKYQLEVLTANNGVEGLQILEDARPDLIISDIMMPQMDGYEFLANVRSNQELVQIPFIFLTAKGDAQDVHRGYVHGAEEYIAKPYETSKMLDLVGVQLDKYFRFRSLANQDFEVLKRTILTLVSTDFRSLLNQVSQQSDSVKRQLGGMVDPEDKFKLEVSGAQTDADLKWALSDIQNHSADLTQLVKDYLTLAELETEEATLVYLKNKMIIEEIDRLVVETSLVCNTLEHITVDVRYVEPITELCPVRGVTGMLSDCLRQLIEVMVVFYEDAAKGGIDIRLNCLDDEMYLSLHLTHALSEGDMSRLVSLLVEDNQVNVRLSRHDTILKIVQGQIRLHNGRIDLNNSDSFTITIALPVHHE